MMHAVQLLSLVLLSGPFVAADMQDSLLETAPMESAPAETAPTDDILPSMTTDPTSAPTILPTESPTSSPTDHPTTRPTVFTDVDANATENALATLGFIIGQVIPGVLADMGAVHARSVSQAADGVTTIAITWNFDFNTLSAAKQDVIKEECRSKFAAAAGVDTSRVVITVEVNDQATQRRAALLQKVTTITGTINPPQQSGPATASPAATPHSSDNKFPNWAIALCVVLPIAFISGGLLLAVRGCRLAEKSADLESENNEPTGVVSEVEAVNAEKKSAPEIVVPPTQDPLVVDVVVKSDADLQM